MTVIELEVDESLNAYWGTVVYDGNLTVDFADTVEHLQTKMKYLLKKFHGLEDVEFSIKEMV